MLKRVNYSLKFIVFSLFFLGQGSFAFAQNLKSAPKLVVGIVVDQMRYDYLTRFSENFGDGGFKRLLSQGYSCQNNYLNYVPTNTAPGHATIYTGANPRTHGIINNYWFDGTAQKTTYCVNDSLVNPVGTGSKTVNKSPRNLLAATLTDAYKSQNIGGGKVISVSIKDRAAILSGGKKADAAYWFRGAFQGHWISSSYYLEKLPKWVVNFNESNLIDQYLTQWNTLKDITSYTSSGPDNSPYERGFKTKEAPVFPYDLAALASANGQYDLIRATPFGNSLTIDFALAALMGEQLGKDKDTDFLLISLSSTDYIGHNFGVNSKEINDAYVRLDQDLERFLNQLDARVGSDNYTLFLTADHGATENSNYLKANGKEGDIFKQATFVNALKDKVYKVFGNGELISHVSGNQIYLNNRLLNSLGLEYAALEQFTFDFVLAWPQIKTAITRTQLIQGQITNDLQQAIYNGFNAERSGDVFYAFDPAVVVYSHTGSAHGSGYEHDDHVPLLFYGKGIGTGVYTQKTNTVDIVPTLAHILGIDLPKTATGTVINAVLKK